MEKLDIDKKEHALFMLERFSTMKNDEKACDFVIKVEEKEMKAHQNILIAGSDYFDAMLSHDTVEKQNGMVDMKGVSFSSVQKCVEFIYTGEIEISLEECDDLLFVVDTMQLQLLQENIIRFLESSLVVKDFHQVKSIAIKYDLKQLDTACDEFALDNLDLLSKENFFT